MTPNPNIAGRWSRGDLGAFVSAAAFHHYLTAYRHGMAQLPPHETFDVPTTFGTVRAYRFGPPTAADPVVLLPGRNASSPMYRSNLPGLSADRTVYTVDLLGEPGMSVQDRAIRGGEDQATWLDEMLAGLGLQRAHLLGVSIGGWTAVNAAVQRPTRIASLVLLDPVFTFARVPIKPMLASVPLLFPGVPARYRRRVLSWISGGADVDTAEAEAALILAGSHDFVLRTPAPRLFTDAQLAGLEIPILALIAGRSVMHDPRRAAARARALLPNAQVEVWPQASHAINGEYADDIAARAAEFWARVDAG